MNARLALIPLITFCIASPCVTSNSTRAAERPNIVLILADDLGYADIGCYGGEISTPNLDRLAADGLRYAQFYNTARCWPSRAALMTGLYPHQARNAMKFGPNAPAAYSGVIPDWAPMVSQLLGDAGYRCYHAGKWHMEAPGRAAQRNWPLNRGFDHSYFIKTQDNYFSPRVLYDDTQRLPRPTGDYYATDVLSEVTVRNLQAHALSHAEQPFFVYLAYAAPHFPLHAPRETVEKYLGTYREGWDVVRQRRLDLQRELGLVDCPLSDRDPLSVPWDSLSDEQQIEWDARMAIYAAMIDRMDQGIGRVLEQVDAMGATQDTLVLFLSDNGSSAEFIVRGDGHNPAAFPGSKQTYLCLETGWSNAANTPFREHKMWVHEGGTATPLIAHWPSGINSHGEINHTVGHIIDLLPTMLDVADSNYPEKYAEHKTLALPGRSLRPTFAGETMQPPEFLFWEHQGNRALRQGDWKVVAKHQQSWELYDMRTDRSETHNVASEHPDRVQQMADAWQQYADETGVVPWETFPQPQWKQSREYFEKAPIDRAESP